MTMPEAMKTDKQPSKRDELTAHMLREVVFEGWTNKSLLAAQKAAGFKTGSIDLYFPGGVLEILEYWSCLLYTSPSPRDA